MAEKITMPRLSDTMEEGTVVKWHKKLGDEVSEGDILVDIETDKAVQEFESEFDGYLIFQGMKEGESAPVDTLMAVIGEKDEKYSPEKTVEASKEAPQTAPEKSEKNEEASPKPAPVAEIPENVNIIPMPLLSDTMEEGTVIKWHKNVGDNISEGDILADIETDKAIQEFENEYEGTVLYLGLKEGETVPVNSILAIIGPAGTDVSGIVDNYGKESKEESVKETEQPEAQLEKSEKTSSTTADESRIFASPLARKMAEEKGIDLSLITGTGDNGRIIKKDIENYKPAASAKPTAASTSIIPSGQDQSIPNSQMRKIIAKRLAESKYTAPHYYLNVDVNMDNCIQSRKSINATLTDAKISFNDIIIKAVAMALRKHPQVNSTWKEQDTLIHSDINIGVAVAVDDGLLVPVIRNTDYKTLTEISAEVIDKAARARERKINANEMEGSTFTVSNLGMFGISSFTSIINQPNSCILSVGAIIEKPIIKNGAIVVGNMMSLSMACDHRTVDGATGAKFLQTLVAYLENPVNMLA